MKCGLVQGGMAVCVLWAGLWAVAQEKKDDKQPEGAAQTGAAAFEKKLDEWKSLLKDMRKIKTQFSIAGEDEKKKFQGQWDSAVAKGNALLPELRKLGQKAYAEAPNEDVQLTRLLVKLATDAIEKDYYEDGYELAKLLIDNECGVPEVYVPAAIGAFVANDYDKAEEYIKLGKEKQVIATKTGVDEPSPLVQLVQQFDREMTDYREYWEKEQALRKAEGEKDDLPRVKLETTKGTIVIELFENEAPETVGNFVSLVEKKFYDGLNFHRVLPNFMAQGGDPNGDGTGGPGYKIYCECAKPEHRNHFRGTLSMAHAGANTGGSQFFLTFLPTPSLNGKHTAFGRVVEGLPVLAELNRGQPPVPSADKIVKATVVRKRDHAYEPHKVE